MEEIKNWTVSLHGYPLPTVLQVDLTNEIAVELVNELKRKNKEKIYLITPTFQRHRDELNKRKNLEDFYDNF